MKIQTFCIVVGTPACNAKCPFCVARMTTPGRLVQYSRQVDERNFYKACRLAIAGGAKSVMLTGDGEPTLYPRAITWFLNELSQLNRPVPRIPLIELQTNAILLGALARGEEPGIPGLTEATLRAWHELGLDTIAISNVGPRTEWNQRIYGDEYGDLAPTVDYLDGLGFTVRLTTMLQKECVDSVERLQELIGYCKHHGVEQLTIRPIRAPAATQDAEASAYVARHAIPETTLQEMRDWLHRNGTQFATLMHGAEVFDVAGQNVCLADCLTVDKDSDDIRTLIFYSDGRIATDWQLEGAVILGGNGGRRKRSLAVVRG